MNSRPSKSLPTSASGHHHAQQNAFAMTVNAAYDGALLTEK
jgi:hypothetical protein